MNNNHKLHLLARTLGLGALLTLLGGCRHSAPPPAAPTETAHLTRYGQRTGIALDSSASELAGIKTVMVGRQALRASLRPTGQVAATDSNSADVTARLPGRILSVRVDVGDTVHKGQLLATVDSTDLATAESAYQTAASHLTLAAHQLQQQKQLAKFGALSEQPLEDAQRAYSAAQAATSSDIAQLKLDQTTLANTRQLVANGELTRKPMSDAHDALLQAQSTLSAAQASLDSDTAQMVADRTVLENTKQLIDNGELTRKPLDDAQSAYAQAQSALTSAQIAAKSAQATYDRANALYNDGNYSKQQLEDAESALHTAQTAVVQNQTQSDLAKDELARQQNIFDKKLNASTALQPAQTKVDQDQHTFDNDRVALATDKTAAAHAREEYDRQQSIFKHQLNASTALQPAVSKLQQDQHTYRTDLNTLETTRLELTRAQTIHKSGIPVSQALQQAQDAYDGAVADQQAAADTLRMYNVSPAQAAAQMSHGAVAMAVTAPIGGVVVSRAMIVGQMTDATTPLAKIVDLRQVYVDAQVYEKDLAKINVGDRIQVTVAGYPGRVFHGTVSYIGHDVSTDTRTVTVRTVLNNPGGLLRPGMYASVVIGENAAPPAVVVPADAVLQDGDRQVVFQEVAPNEFMKDYVRAGQSVAGQVPVLSGLQAGARVVTQGNVLLAGELDKLSADKGQAL